MESGIPVPVCDGVALLTDHYIPVGTVAAPTLLVRSPYGRGFPWDYLFGAQFAGQGFHVVIQSCRGTGGSGGTFEPFRHERADGLAAIAWLREQEWFHGTLATIGPSYQAYVQWALATDPPPELRAMVVQVGACGPYPFFYPGGVFALENALVGAAGLLSFAGGPASLARAMVRLLRRLRHVERTLPLIDAYQAALGRRVDFFEEWLTHPDPGDPYWTSLDTSSAPAQPRVPVSLISGWDDVVLDQTLEQYCRLRAGGSPVRLLVGPWSHTSAFDRGWPVVGPEALRWLRAHLGGEHAGRPDQPVRVHVGGCGQWRDLPGWPPPQARIQPWYLGAGGTLSTRPPASAGSSFFRYDPADPTPSVGGQLLSRRAGAADNRHLEARADVLVFTSAPLTEALEVMGPVSVRLRIRASGPHFDLFARLCDVDPRGRSLNVCDGILRHARAAPADDSTTVAMSSTAYRFAAGHRIRLQVSGGAHPRFARNTGTGETLATATRLAGVDIEVVHESGSPCTLSLPTVSTAA